ncbi:hypothetical protein [Mangrovimonas xylaniphaga]|uniref:hypothetical protein n=1 Tax=Mangrovimonas xylaniphaga TaxID=1645915 RepID=UPI0006B55410|nr:hypothetical protein [Mangrovimonas xylaniphaga]
MNTITKHVVLLILCLSLSNVYAQDTIPKANNSVKIEALKKEKTEIENQEKELLKAEVERINQRFDNGEITQEEADQLKKEAAQKHALNIENRLAIIDNKIALLERNEELWSSEDRSTTFVLELGKGEEADEYDRGVIYIGERADYKLKPTIYDKRTTGDLVFAIGFNNAIIEGESFGDSPYKFGGSGFVELGYAWKTRVFENSNALRLKYGFSFQWNKLDIKDNMYFTETNDIVMLTEFPEDVRKSKFRTTNLVFPVHFEFGPSKKIERDTYFRYSTYKKFKIGIGGYAGFNLESKQKVKYRVDGDREKDKYKGYNVNELVYGVSGYLSFGSIGLYAKYDLSPIFKDQPVDQNNISLGIRFDMD